MTPRKKFAVLVLLVAITVALSLPKLTCTDNSFRYKLQTVLRSSLKPTHDDWKCTRRRLAAWWTPQLNGSHSMSAVMKGQSTHSETCSCKAASSEEAACKLSGAVGDCCCDYASVERVNRNTLNPLLTRLVATPFMRYFKVNLYCDCPFWPDDGMCSMRDCSVCECADHEVPQLWKDDEKESATCSADSASDAAIVTRVDDQTEERLLSIRGWRGFNNPWVALDANAVDYSYINLQQNVERYTGYKGEAAARIWEAIYTQSCFTNRVDDNCTERRIFYRLVSGMHASISAHIANDYLLDDFTGRWGPNLAEFRRRLGNPQAKGYIENLYFTYLFTLRAVQKAAPLLQRVEYSSGSPAEDVETKMLVNQLVSSEALQKVCPIPFHEGRLWKSKDANDLRQQLQVHFQNITSIMDCVGCEKCKLWGKLQLMGIATSLKILFDSSSYGTKDNEASLLMERNEVIALINLLERLSKSIEVVRSMSLQLLNDTSSRSSLGAIESLASTQPLFSHLYASQ